MSVSIRTDDTTVWVDVGAFTVGRFGKLGIDVHTADATGCLQCTHTPTTKDDWHIFVAAMFLHHGVVVTDEFMPRRFREPHQEG
jgi:hypothetical protein